MPPPLANVAEGLLALFPLICELFKVTVPAKFQIPPPEPFVTVFPLTVEPVSVTVPKSVSMPPEPPTAVFPLTVELTRARVPSSTSIPPPKRLAELPVTRELSTLAPAVSPLTAMPPPTQQSPPFSGEETSAAPFVTFSPSTVVVPFVMCRTVPVPPPSKVGVPGKGLLVMPLSVMFLSIDVLPTQLPLTSNVSPALAAPTALWSEL